MTENERIKSIRKALGLTQESMGVSLGISGAALSNVEKGNRSVTDQLRRSICREFNVNECWFRTGEGDMFVHQTKNEALEAEIKRFLSGGDSFREQLVSLLIRLDGEQWAALEKYAESLLNSVASNSTSTPQPAEPFREMTREELHAELDRQLDLQEKAEAEPSVFGSGSSDMATA